MFFLTNKHTFNQNNSLTFAKNNLLSQSLLYCELKEDSTIDAVGSAAFMEVIKNGECKDVFFYVHGFSNQPFDDVFPRAQQLQTEFNKVVNGQVLVVPIVWPCDDDFGVIKDYWDDQLSAELSGIMFSRAIGKLMLWQEQHIGSPCYKRMHLLAHSMGNRVLMKCLDYFANNYGNQGVPLLFKNLFLVAADIPNHALEKGEEGYWITQAASKVHCFYATDDLAMPASKVMNVANRVYSRRLGHTGPEDLSKVSSNVAAIDCNGFNTEVDFPAGHTYFLPKEGVDNLVWETVKRLIMGDG